MHKTGETSDVNHDAGILETNAGKMYVLALYTQAYPKSARPASSFGNQAMSAWMRRLRQAL
jgi:beta-lactamase class A